MFDRFMKVTLAWRYTIGILICRFKKCHSICLFNSIEVRYIIFETKETARILHEEGFLTHLYSSCDPVPDFYI